ncbi:MAG: HEAT repeat domain-containing protein, partial [Planctomycetota bacterium]|nr:HEAT repeat domain-containing protein [Planctomycetota bacterium]
GAVAENLNSPNWPVRIQAIYLLAKSPESKFQKVLGWSAKYDPNVLVRNMAIALGGTTRGQPAQPEDTPLQPPAVKKSPAKPLK